MRRPRARAARLAAVIAATVAAATACGIGSAATTTGLLAGPTGAPITVGISLPLTGSFAADGQASERGYRLWASDVNSHGGLLGRPVRLKILDNKSDPEKLTPANYTTLINTDHVNFTLAPFSSLLTTAAEPVVHKYGYALIAGSAGAPLVYHARYNDVFSTTVPVPDQMVPLVDWALTLPPGEKPLTAAYPMVSDPFADPPVQRAQALLQKAGVKTVYQHSPYTDTKPGALAGDAKAVASSGAQMVLIGSVDVPTVASFIREFVKLKYNPKIIAAASGPDQGQAFLNAVGTGNADGIMVPNGWYGGLPNALSHVLVQDYIAKFGGTASDINADVAEAYSAGQTLALAVTADRSLSNAKLIAYLHSHTVQTVVGPVQFSATGQNISPKATALIFQWQGGGARFVQVLPKGPGSVQIVPTKPTWSG
jgi:branched-chain amino acid transport system substrate-binding protein